MGTGDPVSCAVQHHGRRAATTLRTRQHPAKPRGAQRVCIVTSPYEIKAHTAAGGAKQPPEASTTSQLSKTVPTLAVGRGGVVDGEEHLQQLAVGDGRRVKRHLDALNVARHLAAHLQ